jgi:hypothetical protein
MGPAVDETGAGFADLVVADPQWLRREFDELIAASFGRPPAAPRPAPPGVPGRGPSRPPAGRAPGRLPAARAVRPREQARRQRSPPP